MEVAKFKEEPKGLSMPARTLPPETLATQLAYLVHVLEIKLSVKVDVEENVKRIINLHKEVQESAWGLSIKQMLDAFQYYVDGKLSYNKKHLEPISGYLDAILFKKVIQAYKELKEPKQDLKSIAISVYEKWKSEGSVDEISAPICFDYLYDKGLIPKRDSSDKVKAKYQKVMTAAKGLIYAPLFDSAKWMEKEDLTDTPKYKDILDEMSSIKRNEHPKINGKFKSLVLEGYFKKLKVDLSKIL